MEFTAERVQLLFREVRFLSELPELDGLCISELLLVELSADFFGKIIEILSQFLMLHANLWGEAYSCLKLFFPKVARARTEASLSAQSL